MDAGEFRAAESARESNQDQCCVPESQQVLAPGGDDPADVCREKRGLSMLRGADGAADTLEGLTYDKVAGRGRRVGEARRLGRADEAQPVEMKRSRWRCSGP